jgi:lambda repressor-like predicted transcriptional regulator
MKDILIIKSKIESGLISKTELSNQLGISRVTLDTRLYKGNWKKGELVLLKNIV